jgi:hypothetical protein
MEKMNYETAEQLINTTVEEAENGSAIVSELEKNKDALEADQRAILERYIAETRPIYAAMFVDDFEGNIAGLYNGSDIFVDRSVMQVGSSVDQTIAQAKEVYKHEGYHKENDHTAPLQVMAETKGNIAAVIGGVEFTETGLIEGLTVMQTGDQFVSAEYVDYKNNLQKGMSNAGLGISDIEDAINNAKDVTKIDDRAQEESPEPSYAIAG